MSPQTLKTNGFLNLKPFKASRFHFLALLSRPSVVCICLILRLQVSVSWTVGCSRFCRSHSLSALIRFSHVARLILGNAVFPTSPSNQRVFTFCGLLNTGWFPSMVSRAIYQTTSLSSGCHCFLSHGPQYLTCYLSFNHPQGSMVTQSQSPHHLHLGSFF